MSKVYLKNLIHGKHPLASLLILELFYIIYTYLIADNISIAMGADGFLNDNIFVLSPLEIILSIFIVPPIEELISRIYLNKEFKYFNVSFIFLLFISFLFYLYHFYSISTQN